jgi:hypothetical protein
MRFTGLTRGATTPAARLTRRLARSLAVVQVIAAATIALSALPASASPLPLTPNLDCIVSHPDGTVTAYFGYINSNPVSIAFPIGDFNQVMPGSADQGEPTVFNVGSYPSVFQLTFDPTITPTVSWLLNGMIATASPTSTQCLAATTGAASALTPTTATLGALINPRGEPTAYHFDWGTTTAYGQSTTTQTVSNEEPLEGVATLSGLAPGTTYHYRVVATNPLVSTTGQDASSPPHPRRPQPVPSRSPHPPAT